MIGTTLCSCIGWLDFSEEDQRRARDYLAQFNGDNTLDELGFGIVRDAFADLFFPGTNTIMTRTRYLVFIPALCLIIEKEKLSGKRAEQRLKQLEDRLRESLSQEESSGIIGERAKESLSRYPSSIYWNALRRLRVFLHPGWGLGYYQSKLGEFYKAMTVEKDDDGLSHLNNPEWGNWDKALFDLLDGGHSFITSKGEIRTSLNFELAREEARYIEEKYRALALSDNRPSIISYLLEHLPAAPFRYPWDVKPPPSLIKYVDHARCFSMLSRGATLQYFYLLQEERKVRGIGQPSCDYAEVFARWWKATLHDLQNWKVDEFLDIAASLKALRRPNDRTFIKNWLEVNLGATSDQEMWLNAEAHTLIRQREKITRPNKARLHHTEYLQRWKPLTITDVATIAADDDLVRFGLDYRAWIGSIFVQDIMTALG
jgi:hypothetical protein